jgi:hypothetical protein
MQEVDIKFQNYYLVGGYRFTEDMENEAMKQPFKYVGRILDDQRIGEYNISGRSLLEITQESPAYKSVSAIASKVGY